MATKTKTTKSFPIRKPKLTIEQLYNKPLSAIIRIAVKDLETNVANGAKVDMGDWGSRNGTCIGCLAGHCLLPYTKRVDNLISRNKYAREIALALNAIRNGHIAYAARRLYDNITDGELSKLTDIPYKLSQKDWSTFEYRQAPKKFSKSMLLIASELEKIGF